MQCHPPIEKLTKSSITSYFIDFHNFKEEGVSVGFKPELAVCVCETNFLKCFALKNFETFLNSVIWPGFVVQNTFWVFYWK